jgi:hypothetical protein
MALSTTGDYQTAINQILWAQFVNRGTRFPFNEIVRDGGMSAADATTLRDAFDTYYTAHTARPSLTPAHEDVSSTVHTTTQTGRDRRGGGPVAEDPASGIHTTSQTGRSGHAGSSDDALTDRGEDATGRGR